MITIDGGTGKVLHNGVDIASRVMVDQWRRNATLSLSNGENLIIYGTYSNLNDAFTFETPKSEAEAKAFGKFFDVTGDISEFTQTWTRVKIKDYQ